jgi:hypothetical protein
MKLPETKSTPVTDLREYTFLVYGVPKVGKSTFCSKFEDAIFIATEQGHKFLEVYKVDPSKWSDIVEVARELYKQKDNKKFKTVIFDTADIAYKMCEQYICEKNNIEHLSDLGFGKGYNFVRDEFMRIITALSQAGYGLVFISHSETRDVDEGGIKRSFTDTTLSGSAKKVIPGLCDFIFYCHVNEAGDRRMLTQQTKSVNAGGRSDKLPKIMDLDFDQLKNELLGE